MRMYAHDARAFVHDCIDFPPGEHPTAYQDETLDALMQYYRVSVRGPHGLGKSAMASWIVLWAIETAADVKGITTASVWRQLTKYLWPEVHKWARRLRWDRLHHDPYTNDQLLTLALKLGSTREAFAVASSDPFNIEGAHAERIVYIFDEAKAIPAAIWDAAEGAFSGAGADTGREAYAVAISTPGDAAGRFYEIHNKAPGFEHWWTRHVTVDEAIAAGRISADWVETLKRQWGETNPVYIARVLGEFAPSEDGLIPLSWIEAANDRYEDWVAAGNPDAVTAIGVDVARFGEDLTCYALRCGDVLDTIEMTGKRDLMETTGRTRQLLDQHPAAVAMIDVSGGLGAGVFDRLREMGYSNRIYSINYSEKTDYRDSSGLLSFVNVRAAMWWNMRELLQPDNALPIALNPNGKLTGDLAAVRWKTHSSGRIIIESKDEIRKRLGRSTDAGDAVCQAFWPMARMPYFG